jgi:hypothetical protein
VRRKGGWRIVSGALCGLVVVGVGGAFALHGEAAPVVSVPSTSTTVPWGTYSKPTTAPPASVTPAAAPGPATSDPATLRPSSETSGPGPSAAPAAPAPSAPSVPVASAAAAATPTTAASTVVVPDVAGDSIAAATAAIRSHDLAMTLGSCSPIPSGTGTVVGSTPSAGSLVAPDSTVTVDYTAGPSLTGAPGCSL